MKNYFIFLVLTLIAQPLIAQRNIATDTLFINQIGQEKGLLQLNPKAIEQDSKGFLWVGTEDGLHRYNSYKFESFTHQKNNYSSILDDHIRDILYINDTLWIASNSAGILCYSIRENSFSKLNHDFNDDDLKISYKTFNLDDQFLLFSVKNNILLLNKFSKKISKINLINRNRENYCTSFIKIDESKVLLGTSEGGIQLLNLQSFKVESTNILNRVSNINSLYLKDNSLLIASEKGLYNYSLNSDKSYKLIIKKDINQLIDFEENSLLIASKSGLYKYEFKEELISKMILISNNEIFNEVDIDNLYSDNRENIWIGTEGSGLLQYNKKQKKFDKKAITLPSKKTSRVNPFGFLKENNYLWIASDLGIIRKDISNEKYKLYPEASSSLIYDLVVDYNGDLWTGGFNAGLLKYNRKNDSFHQYKNIAGDENSLNDDDVIEIIPISNNKLWVCTWSGGINEFNIREEKFEAIQLKGKRNNRIRISYRDKANNLWLGSDEGLFKIKQNKNIEIYSEEKKNLVSNRVFAINEDKKGNIWIGTASGITMISKNDSVKNYSTQEGLPNDFIYGLLIDEKNNIWVSTNYGISMLNMEDNKFINFTEKDGLQNNEFNGKAAYVDKNGIMYFGGVKGYNSFDPKKVEFSKKGADVYVESIYLFNKEINRNELYRDTIYFKSKENVITFNYAALNYLNPEKCSYKYTLEGFDKGWRKETKELSTTYTNLEPGTYTFKVMSSNEFGYWNNKIDKKVLIIVPAWYQTITFKVLLLLVVLGSLGITIFSKTSNLIRSKRKLESIVNQRTQDINQKNEELRKSNLELKNQKESVSFLLQELKHRVNNNFQLVSSFLNIQANTVDDKKTRDILKIARNRINIIANVQNFLNNQVEETFSPIEFISEFSKKIVNSLEHQEQLKFKLIYELEDSTKKINNNPSLIGLLLNEIITNAYKYAFDNYSDENFLLVKCYFIDDEYFELIIQDNGKGFNRETVVETSLGLSLIEEMVKQINGELELDSNDGTKYLIKLKIS